MSATPQGRSELLASLAILLAPLGASRQDTSGHVVFRLPRVKGADYSFSVWVHDDGEPQITASPADGCRDEYFWARHFELVEYASQEAQYQEFMSALQAALTSRTRITQKKGWLFTSFHCEAIDGEDWLSIGGNSGARWIAGIPPISGRRHQYFSPPVLQLAKEAAER